MTTSSQSSGSNEARLPVPVSLDTTGSVRRFDQARFVLCRGLVPHQVEHCRRHIRKPGIGDVGQSVRQLVTGTVVETGEPMVVPSIGDEPLFLDRTKSRRDLTKEEVSFVCVPIKIGDEVVGAVSVDRLFTPDVAFDEDVRLLTIIASLIGHAVKVHRMAEDEKKGLVEEKERLQRLWAKRRAGSEQLVDQHRRAATKLSVVAVAQLRL